MTTYSPQSQINFFIQWFKSWSDFQKDDFVPILSQKVSGPEQVNGIVNGMQKLDLDMSGRPPSLFSCQLKLFTEWWDTWGEADRQKMTELLKEADSKFWETLESEMKGTRQKLNEDFMVVTLTSDEDDMNNGAVVNGSSKISPIPPPVFNVKQILPGGGGGSDGEGQDERSGEEEVDLDEGTNPTEILSCTTGAEPQIRQVLEGEGAEV